MSLNKRKPKAKGTNRGKGTPYTSTQPPRAVTAPLRFAVGDEEYSTIAICPEGENLDDTKLSNFAIGELKRHFDDAAVYWGEELQLVQLKIHRCKAERARFRRIIEKRGLSQYVDYMTGRSRVYQEILDLEHKFRDRARLGNEKLAMLNQMIARLNTEMTRRARVRGYLVIPGKVHLLNVNRARRQRVRARIFRNAGIG